LQKEFLEQTVLQGGVVNYAKGLWFIVGATLLTFPAIASVYKFNNWSVQDAAASNAFQCKLKSDDGTHELRAYTYEGSNTLGLELFQRKSLWNRLTEANLYDLHGVLGIEVDETSYAPLNVHFDTAHGGYTLDINAPEERHGSFDPNGNVMEQVEKSLRIDSAFRLGMLQRLRSHRKLVFKDPQGKTTIATFSLSGFPEAFDQFENCVRNGGKL
jgi:hypothetical protein